MTHINALGTMTMLGVAWVVLCGCMAGSGARAQELAPAPDAATVEVRVDTTKTHQTLRGFGACFFMHDLTDYCDPRFYDDLVFDLGVNLVRYPLPPSFDPPEPANAAPATERLSIEGNDRQMALVRSFMERGVGTFFSTPWSPPAWMKTNRHIEHAGHLRPDRRKDYAEFLSANVRFLKERYGLELAAVSIQNELAFPEPYGSCVYNPHSLRETVRAVMRRFDADNLDTKILFHEDTMPQLHRIVAHIRPVMADAETSRFNGHFAVHLGATVGQWRQLRRQLNDYHGREMWQTEASVGGRDWPRNLNNVRLLHNALAAGNVSVWAMWQFSMLHRNGEPTANYHSFRPFFRFVRPGVIRLEAEPVDGDVVVSAWRHESDGNLTVILINQLKEPAVVPVAIAGAADTPKSFRVYRTSARERGVRLADLPGGARVEVSMPAESVVVLQSGPEIEIPRQDGVSGAPPIAAYVRDADERLHHAARNAWTDEDVKRIEELLAEGRDPNAFGVSGWAPLHRAAFPGHARAVATLVAAGADPNLRVRDSIKDTEGDTPLHIAAAQGRLPMARALIGAGAKDLPDGQGWTPLHRAALGGKADVAKYLIEQGFDVKATAKDGWTPLHAAAGAVYDGSFDILEMLLAKGADANAADAEGWTPLHAAAAQGMVAHRHDPRLVLKKIDALLAAGAGLDARDADGNTPLHWAAWIGFMRGMRIADWTAKRLLEAGADPNAANAAGRSPLHHAVQENYAAIAQALVAAGARRDLADRDGVTPDALARAKGFEDVFTVKVEVVEDYHVPGTGKHGAELRQAVDLGDLARVKALIADGADVNARDHSSGWSPLHIAVRLDRADIVKALLDAGALPDIMNRDGITPITAAEWGRQAEILEMLKAAQEKRK